MKQTVRNETGGQATIPGQIPTRQSPASNLQAPPPRANQTDDERLRAAERYLAEYKTTFRMLRAGMASRTSLDGWSLPGREDSAIAERRAFAERRAVAQKHTVARDPSVPAHTDAFAPALSDPFATGAEEDALWEEKLVTIRATVLSVAEPDQKIFLFQHYIRGMTVETCAEILDISVRTAYRLKKRALLSVADMIGV